MKQLILKIVAALLWISLFAGCTNKLNMPQTTSYALRLKPGQDLKTFIQAFVVKKKIEAGWVASCAGSLAQYQIRFANAAEGSVDSGHFEIVSLSGTVSVNGSHIHIAISDSTGKTIGGHLMENCIVYTTAEIIIQSASNLKFKRAKDGTTPWEELQVEEK